MALQAGLSVSIAATGTDGAGAGGYLAAKIDDRPDGRNAGRTSFAPGDTVYFHVFKSSNVRIASVTTSAGTVEPVIWAIGAGGTSGGGLGARIWGNVGSDISVNAERIPQEFQAQFINTDRIVLSFPAAGVQSHEWLGRSLGGLSVVDEQTLVASSSGVAVANVSLIVYGLPWKLNTPALTLGADEDYPIIVHIQGEYR